MLFCGAQAQPTQVDVVVVVVVVIDSAVGSACATVLQIFIQFHWLSSSSSPSPPPATTSGRECEKPTIANLGLPVHLLACPLLALKRSSRSRHCHYSMRFTLESQA